MRRCKNNAFTLIEVLLSIAILGGAIMTMLLFETENLRINRQLEQQFRSALLIEGEMEKIKAALYGDFAVDVGAWDAQLEGKYYIIRELTDQSSTLKRVKISVGYDSNNDSTLATSEILVNLSTLVAQRS